MTQETQQRATDFLTSLIDNLEFNIHFEEFSEAFPLITYTKDLLFFVGHPFSSYEELKNFLLDLQDYKESIKWNNKNFKIQVWLYVKRIVKTLEQITKETIYWIENNTL